MKNMTKGEFEKLKTTIYDKPSYPRREVVKGELFSVSPPGYDPTIRILEPLDPESKPDTGNIRAIFDLKARPKREFYRLVGRKIEAVYERSRTVGDLTEGNLLAFRCGKNSYHFLF